MEQLFESNNRKFTLLVTIYCKDKSRFRVVAEDLKPNSKYVDRTIEVEGGKRTIELKFPESPQKLKIKVQVAKDVVVPPDFMVNIAETDLVTYNAYFDNAVKSFLAFVVPFCQLCGYTPATQNGRIWRSPSGMFNIKFFTQIRDYMTGRVIGTPARIGHQTGIIEVSKEKLDSYTIPMRLIILLHEFSHKYRNPKIGLPISHESGADINALYIYLSLGYSKVDAIYVFANVFLKAQTDGNIRRMRNIMDYITKFESGQFAEKN